MTMARQPVMVRLTPAQALRMERMNEAFWPTEKLSAGEVTRRLPLTQLLWAESERGSWNRREPAPERIWLYPSTFPRVRDSPFRRAKKRPRLKTEMRPVATPCWRSENKLHQLAS